jgi:NitT/TauT family transport system ATP-binding protein
MRIEARHLRHSFANKDNGPEVEVLSDVSFSAVGGEFICIVGPSGCGKTTLLRIIAGLLLPTAGEILEDGKRILGPSPNRTVIFQDYGLFDWKTVIENVEFGLKARHINKSERQRIARSFLELVHLFGVETKYPAQLSGGMKQRAAIARALVVEPSCILMDEPFAALDAQTRHVLQDEVLRIWTLTQKTILLVTHNVEEAVYLADRVIVLSNAPARIEMSVDINLPRPRRQEMRLSQELRALADSLARPLSQVAK